jgi:hypothetical protein
MATQHEQRADIDAEEWLQSLPPEIRAHTVSSQALKEHWITNSPKQLAVTFVDCVRQRAWDGIAYMPSVESKREVRHYTPLQWMRECIGAEPDELMRTVAGHLPNAEEASAAAITMIDLLKDEEPDTLRELCRDYRHGESNMLGWNSLFKMLQEADPVWSQAQAQLQEAVKGRPGRPTKAEENATHCVALKDPTLNGVGRQPKDRKSRLIRTLTNLKQDPEACKQKGTTPERVHEALTKLVRGITPSVEAAKREAGIALPTKPAGGLGIRGAAEDVARRIIATVGAEHARRIADAIHQQLT